MKNLLSKLFNYIFDILYGFDILKGTKEATEFDFLTREEINAYQQKAFKNLMNSVVKSKYYAAYQGKNLHELPLISRKEYVENCQLMVTSNTRPYYSRRSSGSTGLMTFFHVTKEMLTAKRISHQKMLGWYGLKRESREFKIGGLPIDLKTKIYHFFRNKKYFSSYDFVGEKRLKILKIYNRFKPQVLYGYPSVINSFVNFANSQEMPVHHPVIVVTHAENLYEEIRKNLESTFPDTKIVNQYWATESNVAETCPHGNLHIDENTVIAELIDKNENGVGDLYVTNLFSYHLPIIRYKLGDRVKFSDKKCSCGRNTTVIDCIEGREIEYLELADGRSYPITSVYLSSFGENIHSYQMIYYKTEKKIQLNYVPLKKNVSISHDEIRSLFVDNFGLNIEFCIVDELEYAAGGKFKKLIVKE